jgi:endonuclease YncB( thermonuclease family)
MQTDHISPFTNTGCRRSNYGGYALLLLLAVLLAGPLLAKDLQSFPGSQLIPTDWADGDSFLVRFRDGSDHTIRLYGADTFEWHVSDDTDARRLRRQRRYFGLSGYGGTPETSIQLARSLGETAAKKVRVLLARPFTVHTSFADARGDGRFKRVYGFVTTADSEDLAKLLVSCGLARAFGVYHTSPTGLTPDSYRDELRDAELVAAKAGLGTWAYTDWSALTKERDEQRADDQDTNIATTKSLPAEPVDLNSAPRDILMQLPTVGEATANAVISARPYQNVDEILRVPGIGKKRLEILRPLVRVRPLNRE